MKNIHQSPAYGLYLKKLNWQVYKEKEFQYYVRKLPLLGNFVKILKPLKSPNSLTLDSLAKKHHAFAVAVDYSPSKTLQLNLTPSLDEIQAQMDKDTRYEIRKAEENKILVKKSEDIESFIDIWTQNAKRRGFWVPFKKEIRAIFESFGKNAYLFLTYSNFQLPASNFPLAGALILLANDTASYFHAASTPEGRKLAAPSLVVWEAIKIAKKNGCKIFDFEGIIDPRDKNTKKWGGFTRFKKGFGGKEVEYPLPITKYYNPVIKFLFSLFS